MTALIASTSATQRATTSPGFESLDLGLEKFGVDD
jgi:hypothetical protein